MMDRKQFDKIKEIIFNSSKANDIQINYFKNTSFLTRLANSYIHQNVHENNADIVINVIFGKQAGVASTNDLTRKGLIKALRNAEKIAKLNPEDPDYPGLPEGNQIEYYKQFNQTTDKTTPKQRAEMLKEVVKLCSEKNVNASGFVSTKTECLGVATTNGADSFAAISNAILYIITDKGLGTGFAKESQNDFSKINFKKVTNTAIEKCLLSQNSISIDPGEYTVILEEPAVAKMLEFLTFFAFGTKGYHEGRSPLVGKVGKRVFGKNITITDNWNHKKAAGIPFDSEGVKRSKVSLVKDGIFNGLVYDNYYSKKFKTKNTGHALPPGMPYGPLPLNIVLSKGKTTPEEMIRSTKNGILVTRFHYTNISDPMKTLYTGMTRNGTFLIKNGRIAKSIKNMRFTQSIFDALNNVTQISNSQIASGGVMGGGTIVPKLKIKKINFTGKTDF